MKLPFKVNVITEADQVLDLKKELEIHGTPFAVIDMQYEDSGHYLYRNELDYLTRSETAAYCKYGFAEAYQKNMARSKTKPTEAMKAGSIFDTLFLEPSRFNYDFCKMPYKYEKTYLSSGGTIQPNSRLGFWQKQKEAIELTGRRAVKVSEYKDAIRAKKAVRKDPEMNDIFKVFVPHLILCCQDRATGLFLMCEVDLTTCLTYGDLKVFTQKATDNRPYVESAIGELYARGYDFQQAFYTRIISHFEDKAPENVPFAFVFVHPKLPYYSASLSIPIEDYALAAQRVDVALAGYMSGKANGFKGSLHSSAVVTRPKWDKLDLSSLEDDTF